MNGSNDFEKKLAQDVGEVTGTIRTLLPQIERALEHQEEAFRRLNAIETKCALRTGEMDAFKKKLDTRVGKISAIISGVTNTVFIALRLFLWGEK